MPYQPVRNVSPDDLARPHLELNAAGRERHHPPLCPTDDDSMTVPVRKAPTGHEAIAPQKHKIDKTSTEYMIKSGVAGGFAACVAKTVVGPLDRVKILFQASNPQFAKYTGSTFGVVKAMRDIHRSNGLRGLFRGHSATLLRIFPYGGIKFLAYEQVRNWFIPDKSKETPGRRLASGSVSGVISVFFTYPLEVIRVRLAFETKSTGRSNLRKICQTIYNESSPRMPAMQTGVVNATAVGAAAGQVGEAATQVASATLPRSGLANFYRGFVPTLWGMLPYAGFSFLTHDVMGDLLRTKTLAPHTTIPNSDRQGRKPPQLTSWAQLIAGGVAGFVSQTASYPLEVIRRRMQVGGAVGDGHRLRMVEVASKIWAERGWRGFFVGLGIGYVKVVPMAATSFYVYERGKYVLGI